MYKFLLTKLDQDVYEVFAYFFENAEEYESISDLANKLSVSKRRIVLVIDRALDLRERYPFYDIEIIDGRTISLRFASNFLLSKLYSVMLEESMPFQILDRLFREKYLSLENTAQQHFVSNRTVQRKLKEIMDILENYNISLNLKRKPLFVGEEYRIRHFFSYHVLANFGWLKCTLFWPDSKKYYWFQRKTRDVSKLLPRNRSRIQLLALSLYRLKRGFALKEIPPGMTETCHLTIPFEQFKKELIMPLLRDNYLLNETSENEYIFLYYMFSVMTTYLPDEIPTELTMTNHFSEESLQAAKLFSETAKQAFLVPDSATTYLFVNALNIHSTSLMFASKNKIDAFGKTTTDKDYRRVFPKLFPLVQEMYQSLSEQSSIFSTLYVSNNRLLFQYSMLLSIVARIDRSTVRVFHESKFGKIQEIRQKERLKRWFGYTLSFVSEKPDFVVMDYPVDRQYFINQNREVRFFKWNSFPTGDRWLELVEAIEKFQNESINESIQETGTNTSL